MKSENRVRLACIALLGLAGVSGGQQAAQESHEEFVCTSGSERKVVSIYRGAAASDKRVARACRVDYTRNGKTDTLWTSTSNRSYCTAKALALVTKFVESNYSCKPEAVGQPDEAEITPDRGTE
jgi:hypothetical protein